MTRTAFFLSCLTITSALQAEISISTDFPGGSAKVIEKNDATSTLHIEPAVHFERGWPCWWYFRADGLTPGTTLALTVSAAGAPFRENRVLAPSWALPDQAAFSCDNVRWQHTPRCRREGKQAVYSIAVTKETVWFAWGPPFLPSHAKKLLEQVHQSLPQSELFRLATTREGRSVPALRLGAASTTGTPPFGVWVQARQHAWESGSSWVAQGFLLWASSNDPAAVALRAKATIYFVPIMDIDNVAIGAGGKDAVPRDHNRDWVETSRYPEVTAAQNRIRKMAEDGGFDVFLDLHNPGSAEREPYFFGPKRKELPPLQQENHKRWMAIARSTISGCLDDYRFTSYIKTEEERSRVSSNWVRNHTGKHVLSVTLETAWNRPQGTQEGYQLVGQQLGRTLAEYLENNPRSE